MDYKIIITVTHDNFGQESLTVATAPEGAVPGDKLIQILQALLNIKKL